MINYVLTLLLDSLLPHDDDFYYYYNIVAVVCFFLSVETEIHTYGFDPCFLTQDQITDTVVLLPSVYSGISGALLLLP